jgi:hypothetical protein
MEAKPVQCHQEPSYPTRREVLMGAASFALAGFAGSTFIFAASKEGKTIVAPVFKHGEGRGADGCIVVSPPVFLSEEEGMQILREELGKHGIKLKTGTVLKEVRIPARTDHRELVDDGKGKKVYKDKAVEIPSMSKPLKLSGVDRDKKIAVEFVWEMNYDSLGGTGTVGTVQVFDFKATAEYVAEKVKRQGKDHVFLGVFYDPLGKLSLDGDWKKEKKQRKAESGKQLRKQAQDFVAWLKKQKAIP